MEAYKAFSEMNQHDLHAYIYANNKPGGPETALVVVPISQKHVIVATAKQTLSCPNICEKWGLLLKIFGIFPQKNAISIGPLLLFVLGLGCRVRRFNLFVDMPNMCTVQRGSMEAKALNFVLHTVGSEHHQ